MLSLSQSSLLHALGYALVNSLWQFGLLWLIYLVVNSITNLSATKKYGLATILQIVGFGWFCFTVAYYTNELGQLPSVGKSNAQLWGGYYSPFSALSQQQIALALLILETYLPHVALAYLALLIAFLSKLIKCFISSKRFRKLDKIKCDVDIRLFVQKVSYQLGIKRTIEIFFSDNIKSPLTIGCLRPIILLPFLTVTHLSTTQLEAVILHEIAHIKRYDYIANLLLSVIEVMLFFNPFSILIARHIRRERENCCDDRVLQYQYDAGSYAHALLTIAKLQHQLSGNKMVMNAVDRKQSLLIRVKRMIEKKDSTYNYRNRLLLLVFLSAVLSVVAWIAPGKQKSPSNIVVKTIQYKAPNAPADQLIHPLFDLTYLLINKNAIAIVNNEKRRAVKGAVLTSVPHKEIKTLINQKSEKNFKVAEVVTNSLLAGIPAQSPFFSQLLVKQNEVIDLLNNVKETVGQKLDALPVPAVKVPVHFSIMLKKVLAETHKNVQNNFLNNDRVKIEAKKILEATATQQGFEPALAAAEQKAADYYLQLEKLYQEPAKKYRTSLQKIQFNEPTTWNNATDNEVENERIFSYAPNNVTPRLFSYDYKEKATIIRSKNHLNENNKDSSGIIIIIYTNPEPGVKQLTTKPRQLKKARF